MQAASIKPSRRRQKVKVEGQDAAFELPPRHLTAPLKPTAVDFRTLLGARPESLDSLWSKIDEALSGHSSLETAIGQLHELGFELKRADGGAAHLKHPKFSLELEQKRLGSHEVLQLKLEEKDKAGEAREGIAIEGTVIPPKLWKHMKESFERTYAAFEHAVELAKAKAKKEGTKGPIDIPTDFDDLKAFTNTGKPEEERIEDAKKEQELLAALAPVIEKLKQMEKDGTAPKSIVIYVDGPDGAGKTSTASILMKALADAGLSTRVEVFKGRSPEELRQPIRQRYRDRGIPENEGEAVLWDRGPAGDAVYIDLSPSDVLKLARGYMDMRAKMQKSGILVLDLHIYADLEKQAETFGKRLAYQKIGEKLEQRLLKHGRLTERARNQLAVARTRIDAADFKALGNYAQYQERFLKFSELTGMQVINATKRHDARLQIIDAFFNKLTAWETAHAKAA